MKFNCLIIGCLVINLFPIHARGQNARDTTGESVYNKLDEYLRSASSLYLFSGTALVAKKGTILLNKGYGWKNAATKTLNDSNTIFQIGSVTKTFTAAIILKLQELGKLSIYDPVVKYIPGYPGGDKITVQHLLTHTSGIFSFDVDETDTIAWTPVSQETILGYFQNRPLGFEPGTKYSYSNSGYFLLGMIIEKITGHAYEQVVRAMIFDPLQMTHSGFDFIHLTDTLKATGYGKYDAVAQMEAHLTDSTFSFAAGEIYSTTGDLYKWARAIAKEQFLSAVSWKQAFTPFKQNYGYGWFIDSLNESKYVGHSGGIMGFLSYLMYFPDRDITIILLNNYLNETATLVPLIQDLSAILLQKPYELPRIHKEFKVNASDLNKFIGTYSLTSSPKRTIIISKENDHLTAKISGQTELELVFQTETKFELKGVSNASGEFIMQNGQVTKFLVSQNGQFEWKKIK